jgi:biotin carboxyl carrier protein
MTTDRTPEGAISRPAGHDAIARLADALVPALSAALGASGMAEVEIREAGWRVRVRRAPDPAVTIDADGQSHRRRPPERRGSHNPHPDRAIRVEASTNGSGASAHDDGRSADRGTGGDHFRAVATSPAVGTFRPARDVRAGARVRAGDRLGQVDVLGVPQEVVSPVDGIVMVTLVEADDAVEFGQALVELERASESSGNPLAVGPGEA